MKRNLLFLAITLATKVVVAQSPQMNPERFTLIPKFSDEFTGTGLDLSKWYDTPIDYFQTDLGTCYYSDPNNTTTKLPTYFTWYVSSTDNFMINNSGTPTANINLGNTSTTPPIPTDSKSMKLSCRQESNALNVRKLYYDKSVPTSDYYVPQSTSLTGKIIGSKQIFYHGYFEIRAKLPSSNYQVGQQFWMYHAFPGTRPSWLSADYSEIDVFEINDYDYYRSPSAIHHWPTSAPDQYVYNSTHTLNNPIPINLSGSSGWHTYGVNWQSNSVDFYIDGQLTAHEDELSFASWLLDPTTHLPPTSKYPNPPYSMTKTLDVLVPMRVYLSTKFVEPCTTTLPPAGEDVNFEIDYFKYYKMNPLITNYTVSGTTANVTASQGIDNEDYTFTKISGPGTVGTKSQVKKSASCPVNGLSSVPTVIKVSSTTGASFIDTEINPSLTSETYISLTAQNCWNVCQADILAKVNDYFAKCITAPGGALCTTTAISNRNIKFTATDFIELGAGFEVSLGASFEAQVP